MNREIKFRAWHLDEGMLHFDFDTFKKDYHDQYGNIMQYTGLKDKNGKEIYDGDIVDYGYKKSVVVWYQNGWCSAGVNEKCCELEYSGKSPYQVYLEGGHCVEMDSVSSVHHTPKVIGNIYENPDLLTNNN